MSIQQAVALVGDVADDLKKACIRKAMSLHAVGGYEHRLSLRSPPLLVGNDTGQKTSQIGLINLNSLARAFYDGPPPDEAAVITAWSDACELAVDSLHRNRVEIAKTLQGAFPQIQFYAPGHIDPRVMMIQFLMATGWHLGSLKMSTQFISLGLGKHKPIMLLDEHAVEWMGRRMRLRTSMPVSHYWAYREYVGYSKRSTPASAAVFTYLWEALPECQYFLRYLFSVAIHCGIEGERAITDNFDVEVNQDREYRSTLFMAAKSIILHARENPITELVHALDGLCTREQIYHYMPEIGSARYTPRMREKFLAALEVMKAQHMQMETPKTNKSMSSLMQLQALIRG